VIVSDVLPPWIADAVFDAKRPGWRGRNRAGASEFSHGRGLTPPGLEGAGEAEGGRYRGRTPPVEPKVAMNRHPSAPAPHVWNSPTRCGFAPSDKFHAEIAAGIGSVREGPEPGVIKSR
jgi:hypothetical protein